MGRRCGANKKGYREDSFIRPTLDGVNLKQVLMEENDMLTAPFSFEEIKEVVWECDDNKSLGPTGESKYKESSMEEINKVLQ